MVNQTKLTSEKVSEQCYVHNSIYAFKVSWTLLLKHCTYSIAFTGLSQAALD